MIKVNLRFNKEQHDDVIHVESMVPAGDKFPYWTFYFPAVDGLQRVKFINMKNLESVDLQGVPEQNAFEQASDIVAREANDGVSPDQVSGLFSKHPD